MTKITQQVHHFLLKNPVIIRNLQEGLINVRALAVYIADKENIPGSVHAVMSAIRRFDLSPHIDDSEDIANVLRVSKISTKSRLVLLTISRDPAYLKKLLPELLAKINPSIGDLIRSTWGRKSLKLIIDHTKKDEVISLIKKEYLIDIKEHVGEINIDLGQGYERVRGIGASILQMMAINSIPVQEVFTAVPEIILIVNEKDIGVAHEALLTFFY
jgi:hypothetical protein